MGRRWPVAGAVQTWGLGCALLCAGAALLAATAVACAQDGRTQDARAIVQQAVHAELYADGNDHSHWRYVESEDGGLKFIEVETEHGALKRRLEEDGRPASAAALREDDENNERFAHDPSLQEKQRDAAAHDDKSATELLNEMPEAFVWKFESEGPETITLSYRPNDSYRPPDMEARVMGRMAGTMVVSKPAHRIKTFKGTLTSDIEIGWGLLARIKQGGTFDVERRQVGPGMWVITETHVHISGHALFFKTIGQQQDEVKTDFTQVPAGTTLEQALGMLTAPPPAPVASRNACCKR